MIKILAKLFIKDYKNFSDINVRKNYGFLSGILGIFLNCFLFIFKFIVGQLSASVSLMADAFNNLSDAASSIISILGFKLAAKKPDSEHPFGHGRFEYVAALVISFMILYVGIQFCTDSIKRIGKVVENNLDLKVMLVIITSILIKFYMFIYNLKLSKKIDSLSLKAVAIDSLSDILTTALVLISFLVFHFTGIVLDAYIGFLIALFIIKEGVEALKDTLKPILGSLPTKEFVEEIEQNVLANEYVLGMHDLVVHDYGPGRKMISLHVEVDGNLNMFFCHEIIDEIEKNISKKFNCSVVIHMDPIDTKNEKLIGLTKLLKDQIVIIDSSLQIHDVRIIPGHDKSNLIFDIVKPFDCKIADKEIIERLQRQINVYYSDIQCIATVETPLV